MLALQREETGSGIQVIPEENEDTTLLGRVVERDRAAFTQLYRRFHARLYRYLYRMLREHELTEELVDDVFLTVWDKAASFRGQSSVSTWIIGIAYRKGLKAYRRHANYAGAMVSSDSVPEFSDDTDATPEDMVRKAQESARIQAGLDRLSAQHRSVMELTILGYSYPEISEIVDCPVNTVKTRMFHARRQMQKMLQHTDDRSWFRGGSAE